MKIAINLFIVAMIICIFVNTFLIVFTGNFLVLVPLLLSIISLVLLFLVRRAWEDEVN